MQIFIDSANLDELKHARQIGVIDGITTNPSLIRREKKRTGLKFKEIIKNIFTEFNDIPISVEVLSTKYEDMMEEAHQLRRKDIGEVYKNMVIKLPCTEDGLKACYHLSAERIETNVTLCFQPLQALLAAKARATYISPFIGRLDDQCEEGINLIGNIKMIYANYGYETKILVASVRNPIHLLNAARIGADCATVPFPVIQQLLKHPLTASGLEQFLKDAKATIED